MCAAKQQIGGRVVQPELLDSLPANNPDAIRSRRDLRRLNWWMRNASHIRAAVDSLRRLPAIILETGSGDGTFMLSVARELKWKHPVRLTLLDMQPVISAATLASFRELGWDVDVRAEKLQDWLAAPPQTIEPHVDLILGNLFWHHFHDAELRECFARISQVTRAFIACEPRRWAPAYVATRLLWAIGCNAVTRHDARISVDAGFHNQELSVLWPLDSGMELKEYPAGYASHLFVAERTLS